jgi:uncharacterized protein (TIGR02145 family)
MKKILKTTLLMLTGLALFNFTLTSCKKHHTTPAATTVTDADGNVYQTVQIGTQTWTTENLKTTKYNDGTPIVNVTDGVAWSNLLTPAYCWYNNDVTNKATFGALYNYYAATDPKIAPAGWHVPTEAEWQTLVDYLGGAGSGGKLKEVSATSWLDPNTGATNESKFTAKGAGRRIASIFEFSKTKAVFWASTNTTDYILFHDQVAVVSTMGSPQTGHSIRLIKD